MATLLRLATAWGYLICSYLCSILRAWTPTFSTHLLSPSADPRGCSPPTWTLAAFPSCLEGRLWLSGLPQNPNSQWGTEAGEQQAGRGKAETELPPKTHKLVPERNGASFLPISSLPQPLPGKQRESLGWLLQKAGVTWRMWGTVWGNPMPSYRGTEIPGWL